MRVIFLFVLLLTPFSLFAETQAAPINRVIYITLDGTRWQDFYNSLFFFNKFWNNYASKAQLYGGRHTGRNIEVASVPISLPSYQSQMTGSVQPCYNNGCGRVTVETLPEKLLSLPGWRKKDVAIFASWPTIDESVAHIKNNVISHCGNFPVVDPDTQIADEFMTKMNLAQNVRGAACAQCRLDQYTFDQALHYLNKHKPKFLWIAFTEADDAAHAVNLVYYHKMLRLYDELLDKLFKTLKQQNLFDSTLIIVTTDHGRGDGINWPHHGPGYPESKKTWAFVLNGKLIADKAGSENYSTLSIRPTVEAALAKV